MYEGQEERCDVGDDVLIVELGVDGDGVEGHHREDEDHVKDAERDQEVGKARLEVQVLQLKDKDAEEVSHEADRADDRDEGSLEDPDEERLHLPRRHRIHLLLSDVESRLPPDWLLGLINGCGQVLHYCGIGVMQFPSVPLARSESGNLKLLA